MFPKAKQYDLVIVGAGLSGLAAAVEAVKQNLHPLVIEKGRTIGGDGNYVEGAMGVDSYLQKEKHIKIDPLKLLHEELQYSHYEANGSHLKHFIDHSGETIDWLHDLGVKFSSVGKQGNSWPTIHAFAGGGHAAIQVMVNYLKQHQVEIVTSLKADQLLVSDGQINGLVVKDESTGQKRNISTSSVILSTGGYADNPELVKKRQSFTSRLMVVSDGKSTGDGMQLAWQVDADHYQMGAIQYGGGSIYDPTKPAFVYMGSQLGMAATQEAILWVNEHGERFVNEDVNDNMCHAGNAILTQARVFSILDQSTVDHLNQVGLYKEVGNSPVSPEKLDKLPQEIDQYLKQHAKFLTKADSVDELAQKLHLPALPQSIKRYNQLVSKGEDADFGKAAKYLTGLKQGPYYAVELGVGMSSALGGLKVNNQNEVLNSYGYPIPGLYAVGNDAGGMLVGDTYAVTLPGSTAGYAVFSGRNAVQSIANH